MDGGRARRAGVLDAGRRLEAEAVVGLEDEARGEVLGREAGVEVAEHDLVDVGGPDAGMGDRLARDPRHQALDGLALEPAEFRMGPSDDASGHVPCLLFSRQDYPWRRARKGKKLASIGADFR